jgi:hypothetical protein
MLEDSDDDHFGVRRVGIRSHESASLQVFASSRQLPVLVESSSSPSSEEQGGEPRKRLRKGKQRASRHNSGASDDVSEFEARKRIRKSGLRSGDSPGERNSQGLNHEDIKEVEQRLGTVLLFWNENESTPHPPSRSSSLISVANLLLQIIVAMRQKARTARTRNLQKQVEHAFHSVEKKRTDFIDKMNSFKAADSSDSSVIFLGTSSPDLLSSSQAGDQESDDALLPDGSGAADSSSSSSSSTISLWIQDVNGDRRMFQFNRGCTLGEVRQVLLSQQCVNRAPSTTPSRRGHDNDPLQFVAEGKVFSNWEQQIAALKLQAADGAKLLTLISGWMLKKEEANVTCTVRDKNGTSLTFTLKENAPFSIMQPSLGLNSPSLAYLEFDGDHLSWDDTPGSLGLENDDLLALCGAILPA